MVGPNWQHEAETWKDFMMSQIGQTPHTLEMTHIMPKYAGFLTSMEQVQLPLQTDKTRMRVVSTAEIC
ncbi:MAG: hypothetical protein ACREF9_08345, partial [Opitutaceae bacterium]